jgi:uncharacterized protein HemX
MARRPFAAFFFLLVVAAGAAAYIFFSFQQLNVPDASRDAAASAKNLFGGTQEKKLRETFDIIRQRQEKSAQMISSTYPEVFVASREK